MMKAYLLKTAGLAALALLLRTSGFAQDQVDDDKDTARLGGHDEIVIKHKGDKDAKVVIEIKGNQVYINGKPANDYSDDNISVHKKKEFMVNGQTFTWSGDGDFPGIAVAPSPFRRHGGTMSIDGDVWSGSSNRAFLGVTTESVTRDGEKGAEIREISKGSAAFKAGLKQGDVITRVDEIKVEGPQSLADAIHKYKPEDKITLTFKRDGKEQKMTIPLGKAPGATVGSLYKMPNMNFNFDNGSGAYNYPGAPRVYGYSYGAKPRLGIKAQDTEDGKGVKVLEVGDESAAEKAGMEEGDIITKFDGKDVNSATDLAELARASKDKPSIKVSIIRDGKTKEIDIKIPRKLKTADL
jgi:serine protease Do